MTMDRFYTWVEIDGIDTDGDDYSGVERCIDFDIYIWFKLGKSVWKKHRSVFQDHVKYIHNDIVKPFRVVILQYAERVREMHDLENYLPPPSIKGVSFESASWYVQEK